MKSYLPDRKTFLSQITGRHFSEPCFHKYFISTHVWLSIIYYQLLYRPIFFNILYHFHCNICVCFPVKRNVFITNVSTNFSPKFENILIPITDCYIFLKTSVLRSGVKSKQHYLSTIFQCSWHLTLWQYSIQAYMYMHVQCLEKSNVHEVRDLKAGYSIINKLLTESESGRSHTETLPYWVIVRSIWQDSEVDMARLRFEIFLSKTYM